MTKEEKARRSKIYYDAHKSEAKKYCANNRLKLITYNKIYRDSHKEEAKSYYLANKVSIGVYNKLRSQTNKIAAAAYKKVHRNEDPLYKMSTNLRSRLWVALKAKPWQKNNHFADYIGCSLEGLKDHLEKQFTIGMDWDSYGERGWHVDHIIPLASATTIEEMYKLCHYTNLQPLWWDANLSKGDR